MRLKRFLLIMIIIIAMVLVNGSVDPTLGQSREITISNRGQYFQSRHHKHKRNHVHHRLRHRRRARHKRNKRRRTHRHHYYRYLVTSPHDSRIYSYLHFMHQGYRASPGHYKYRNYRGLDHHRVRVIKKQEIVGRPFYYVRVTHHISGWVYGGNLSHHKYGRYSNFYIRPPHLSKSAVSKDRRQIVSQSLQNINEDRWRHHLRLLSQTPSLTKVARLRAYQLIFAYGHFSTHGGYYFVQDARHFGYDPDRLSWGENISPVRLGIQRNGGSGAIGRSRIYYSPTYYGRNGKEMADEINKWYFNYDSGAQWGHRKNILTRRFRKVGVGVSYDPHYRIFYQVEDFIS